jgi:hypothetical protein
MRKITMSLLLLLGLLKAENTIGQPIPVELMVGNQYSTINLVVSKQFAEASKLGFFHLNSLTMHHDDKNKNDLALQNLLFYEFKESFRITGGAFYSTKPGFSPTAGLQYLNIGKKWFILLSPRVNIENDPSVNMFTIIRYKTRVNEKAGLYASLQALNIFDGYGHIKSYQWFRAGIDLRGTQLGLAANFDEFGPDASLTSSYGIFLRKEIFQ